MIRPALLAIAIVASCAGAARAQAGFQDTVALDRAVAAFAGHPIGVEGGARTTVDTRLRLASCPTVSLSWRTDAHDAVVITCTGPEWRLFVPMILAPTPAAVAVAAPAAPAPKPEIIIKRGDPVTIQASAPGFTISREGVAMSEAPAGGRLLVDVNGTKKPVQAVAVSAGVATLPGWTQ